VFGREVCPNTGRRHLQGYIYFKNGKTLDGVKRSLGDGFGHIHLEPAIATAEKNREYCVKDGDFEEFGKLPSQGRRSDLATIKRKITDGIPEAKIAEEHFSIWIQYRRSFAAYRSLVSRPEMRVGLRCYLLIGEPGVGKTRFVYDYAREVGQAVYRVPDPELRWFDGYTGEKIALIDDYRGSGLYGFLLQLLDIYPLQVPIKGGFVWWQPDVIFLTSNDDPETWFPEKDEGPLRRRLTRVLRMGRNDDCPWTEQYGMMKLKLNIE
jgi:hypothetical protein